MTADVTRADLVYLARAEFDDKYPRGLLEGMGSRELLALQVGAS